MVRGGGLGGLKGGEDREVRGGGEEELRRVWS